MQSDSEVTEMDVQDVAIKREVPVPRFAMARSGADAAPPIAPAGVGEIVAAELLAGFSAWRIWMILGWDDIRQRYRRSVLGPFWITLSMGLFILLLGIIYSRLFHTDLATYMPYLSVGYIVWGFISQVTNESCMAFQEGARIIKQIKLPFSIYILRIVWRNVIVFLHTIVIYIPVAIIFKVEPTLAIFLVIPALFLVLVNVTWVALVLAILTTRFRDILPIVGTGTQIAMFATPIMWQLSSLSGRSTLIAELNPLYHLLEIVRAPILGTVPDWRSWLVAGVTRRCRFGRWPPRSLVSKTRRIVFWL